MRQTKRVPRQAPRSSNTVRRTATENHVQTLTPEAITPENLALALGVSRDAVLTLARARVLDDFILAEPLERQELCFHEASLSFAALLTELHTLDLDDGTKRAIVAEILPGIVDAWLGARMHGAPTVTVTIAQGEARGARRLSLGFLGHALMLWRFVREDNARSGR